MTVKINREEEREGEGLVAKTQVTSTGKSCLSYHSPHIVNFLDCTCTFNIPYQKEIL